MTKTNIVYALFAVIAFLTPVHESYAESNPKTMTLYKNPQCGCCEGYAEYMREQGYTVKVVPTHDPQRQKPQKPVFLRLSKVVICR